MRRYRRNSVENWGWPPPLFKEKPLFPPISYKKAPVKFFDTDSEKGVPKQKTRFPQKTKQNASYRTPKSSARKVSEKSGKFKFHTKKRQSVPSSSTLFIEGNIARQLDSRFLSFWLASWGGPILITFAINVEWQRRKTDRRISSIIYKGSCIHQLKKICWQEHCPISLPQSRTQ